MKKLTMEEENIHNSASKCWICEKAFSDDLLKKIQDHNYITGKYRGPAHSICNLQLRIKPEEAKLNIFFHNMKNYDGHLISKVMGRASQEQISAIPNNMEKYLTFEIGNQRYMDSFQLMSSSLDTLVANLGAELCSEEDCKNSEHLYKIDDDRCFAHPERFPITQAQAPKERPDLIFRKGILPYNWFDSSDRFNETSLPPIEAFNSILNKSICNPEDYIRAQELWQTFNMKTFREYHNLYLKLDILLLADGFQAFRKMMKGKFGLDSAHYISFPLFAED